MGSYLDIGHDSPPQQTELWWWENKSLNRVTPLGQWNRDNDYRFSHSHILGPDYDTVEAAGRVDHQEQVVSWAKLETIGGLKERAIRFLLKRAFPGYQIVEF